MAEAAPVPNDPAVFGGVTITPSPPLARWSLRARDPKLLAGLLGSDLPARIGAIAGGAACLGPDEWLLRLPAGTSVPSGDGQPLSVVDVSERQLCFVLEGPRAAEVLMAGCPRDVAGFAVGYATRTVFEGVEIIILRTGEARFEVEVWRSFAPWLWLALTTAAGQLV